MRSQSALRQLEERVVEEWTSLKKDFIEHKCYAEDLGFIGNLVVKGATKRPSW